MHTHKHTHLSLVNLLGMMNDISTVPEAPPEGASAISMRTGELEQSGAGVAWCYEQAGDGAAGVVCGSDSSIVCGVCTAQHSTGQQQAPAGTNMHANMPQRRQAQLIKLILPPYVMAICVPSPFVIRLLLVAPLPPCISMRTGDVIAIASPFVLPCCCWEAAEPAGRLPPKMNPAMALKPAELASRMVPLTAQIRGMHARGRWRWTSRRAL